MKLAKRLSHKLRAYLGKSRPVDKPEEKLLDPQQCKPWMTQGLIEWMEKNIPRESKILEFGGGGSTLWWLKNFDKVVTVDAAHSWAASLINSVSAHPTLLSRWVFYFVPCNWHTTFKNPRPYWAANSSEMNEAKANHLEEAHNHFPAWFKPDVVVIDGSVRPQCAAATSKMIECGADFKYIVVDNMETMRPHVEGIFKGFTEIPFEETDPSLIPAHQNGKWCSSVFVRDEPGS